jgi:hypothetical protein
MSEKVSEQIYSERTVTLASRDIIKIERDCFYGDQPEVQRLEKIRAKLNKIFVDSYQKEGDII